MPLSRKLLSTIGNLAFDAEEMRGGGTPTSVGQRPQEGTRQSSGTITTIGAAATRAATAPTGFLSGTVAGFAQAAANAPGTPPTTGALASMGRTVLAVRPVRGLTPGPGIGTTAKSIDYKSPGSGASGYGVTTANVWGRLSKLVGALNKGITTGGNTQIMGKLNQWFAKQAPNFNTEVWQAFKTTGVYPTTGRWASGGGLTSAENAAVVALDFALRDTGRKQQTKSSGILGILGPAITIALAFVPVVGPALSAASAAIQGGLKGGIKGAIIGGVTAYAGAKFGQFVRGGGLKTVLGSGATATTGATAAQVSQVVGSSAAGYGSAFVGPTATAATQSAALAGAYTAAATSGGAVATGGFNTVRSTVGGALPGTTIAAGKAATPPYGSGILAAAGQVFNKVAPALNVVGAGLSLASVGLSLAAGAGVGAGVTSALAPRPVDDPMLAPAGLAIAPAQKEVAKVRRRRRRVRTNLTWGKTTLGDIYRPTLLGGPTRFGVAA